MYVTLSRQALEDEDSLISVYGSAVATVILSRHTAYWDMPESYYERRLLPHLPLAYADDLNDDPHQLVHEMMCMAGEDWVRGSMNFIIYTYDPGETPLRFRTIQICEHALLGDALRELNRQIERLEESGIYRTAVAWESFDQERPVTTTFEDTEKRVRFIVDNYGKAGSGVSHGVLDLNMARKLIGTAPEPQVAGKRPKVPCETYMPAEQKACGEDRMAAIRSMCANSTHDPLKKFEKKD